MFEPSVPLFEMEKMIEKKVASSLMELIRSDKGKEKVVIEDDKEAKGESVKKGHIDDTWQDDEFFKKMSAKRADTAPVVSEKFEKLDKKLEKLHVFMKSKGMDQC
ncbi:hypothetical protein JCGZ_18776 [Jatropha curcas]|uniref:Uncharacterized protein n=1 Tax=Jatropha curcas TaxID=180498 RepID=A0A067LMA3_JATCU|nr:hypothetical protein JCGZ_18776 [Jatropha curcas]